MYDLGMGMISLVRRNKEFNKNLEIVSQKDQKDKHFFTVGDTGLSSRVISHWGDNKVLPDGVAGKGGWRRFTFSEVVWLKVVVRLRNFGFSLSKISEIKKQIMACNRKYGTYPLFDFFVEQAWRSDAIDPYIIVLADGTADIATPIEIENAKQTLPPSKRDMLLISIKFILEEIGINAPKAEMLMPLTPQEIILLGSLSKESREVKVRMNKGKIKEIEHTTVVSDHPDIQKIDRGIEERGDYAEVTIKYSKGVKQSSAIKKTIRL